MTQLRSHPEAVPSAADLAAAWAGLPLEPGLIDRAHARLPELWSLLERWVAINSFTANHAGCNQMLDELSRSLALPDLTERRLEGRGAAAHGLWTSRAWGQRPGVLLVGHHDTVFPPGTFEGFSFDEHNVYGPGVLDMKGGLAVARTALAVLADAGALARLPVALVSVSDEETGSADGRRALAEVCASAGAGLVLEAGRGNDAIVTRRKGTGKLLVTAHGRAAHAGNDLAAGRNAIWALARWIDGASRAGKADGSVTVNVGLVSGGTSANTVPAQARCELDVRVSTRIAGQALWDELEALAGRITDDSDVTFTFEGGLRRQPLEASAASRALAARYGALARAVGLSAEEAGLQGGGSDANTLAEHGVPVIDGLGPRGRAFHTPQEQAEIATFARRLGALLAFLAQG